MQEPSDVILDVLLHIAKVKNRVKEMRGFDSSRKKVYDIDASGHLMVMDFFNGNLGKSMLDANKLIESSKDSQIDLETFV